MKQSTDNGPKDGDFVRYIAQLEQEQFKTAARLQAQAQARSPGQVRAVALAKTDPTTEGKPPAPKLTAAQAQQLLEKLTQGQTLSNDQQAAALSWVSKLLPKLLALLFGVVFASQVLDIPVWITLPIAFAIIADWIKKSRRTQSK
jgi:hypothetical protein